MFSFGWLLFIARVKRRGADSCSQAHKKLNRQAEAAPLRALDTA